MVVSVNKGGADVKHPRCQQQKRETGRQRTPGVWRLGVCVHKYLNICIWVYKYMQVCTSLPVNMSVYVFGLPSVPQQRPSELFSRSLATLIMSGPPQSINQPSAAPLNPQTGAQGSVCVSWAEAELFKGFNLQWISAVNTVIPVISAISGKTSARLSKEVSVCE